MPQIIEALGGDHHALLPDGYWPDNVFDSVVVLRYDNDGKFVAGSERLIHEDFANPPGADQWRKLPMNTCAVKRHPQQWSPIPRTVPATIGYDRKNSVAQDFRSYR